MGEAYAPDYLHTRALALSMCTLSSYIYSNLSIKDTQMLAGQQAAAIPVDRP